MKRLKKNKHWPWGFRAGDEVVCDGRYALVVRAYKKDIEPGMVPIIFTDRKTLPEAFICVPADNLYYDCVEKIWKWGPFTAGDLVVCHGFAAQVVMAFRRDVPPGHVPIIFSHPGRPLTDAGAIVEATEFVPINDLYYPLEQL